MLKLCSIREFTEKSTEWEKIILFGAGTKFRMLQEIFFNTIVWDKLGLIIDNDKKKQNTQIVIMNKEFKIISLDELEITSNVRLAILITCNKYNDIVKQLDNKECLRNIDFYCLSHMIVISREEEALRKSVPSSLKLYNKAMIPKIIHYCWFGGAPLPDKYKVWMESWHKYCPDYKIIQWNESNYDIKKNNYMRQAYESKKWGFVPDYARLDIVYKYGGIYLDTDIELVQNMDDLLYQKGFAGFQCSDQINLGSGFGAVEGLPIIKKMRDFYDNISFIKEDGGLNLIESPRLQTQTLKEYGLKPDGEFQIIRDLTIYPEKMLNGKNLFTRRVILKPYTRAIHHFDGSWLSEEEKKIISQREKEYSLQTSGEYT